MAEASPVKFIPKKRRRYNIDWTKCIICQKDITGEKLSKPTPHGLERFKQCSVIRHDEVSDRMAEYICEISTNICWHTKCYKLYTNKTHIDRITKRQESATNTSTTSTTITSDSTSDIEAVKGTRSAREATDWTKCVICQKLSHKNVKEMIFIRSPDGDKALKNAANVLQDQDMLIQILEVDLLAADARYHKPCRDNYVMQAKRVHKKCHLKLRDLMNLSTR